MQERQRIDARPNDDHVSRRDVERTIDDMNETVEAIKERLSPHHLAEQAKENVREATIGRAEHMMNQATHRVEQARSGIVDTLMDNPVPAALTAIGLGWLFLSARGGHDDHDDYEDRGGYGYQPTSPYRYGTTGTYRSEYGSEYGRMYGTEGQTQEHGRVERTMSKAREGAEHSVDRARRTVGHAGEQVGEQMGEIGERVGEIGERVGEAAYELGARASELGHQVRSVGYRRIRRTRSSAMHMMQRNPVAVGAMALGLGMAVGLLAPGTRREDEWMGESRERLMNRAQEMARETVDKVQHVAENVAETTREAAVEEARKEGLAGSTQGAGTAQQAGSTSPPSRPGEGRQV